MGGGVLGKRSRPPLPLSTGGSRASYSPSELQLSQLCAKRYTPTSAVTVLLGMCQALDRQRVHAHARTHVCAFIYPQWLLESVSMATFSKLLDVTT